LPHNGLNSAREHQWEKWQKVFYALVINEEIGGLESRNCEPPEVHSRGWAKTTNTIQ